MDIANGSDIAAHIQQLVTEYTVAVIMAETGNEDFPAEVRILAAIRAKALGEHIFADIEHLATHAAFGINATNEENLVNEFKAQLDTL